MFSRDLYILYIFNISISYVMRHFSTFTLNITVTNNVTKSVISNTMLLTRVNEILSSKTVAH